MTALRDADKTTWAADTQDEDDLVTTEEFAVMVGMQRCAANVRLRQLVELGKAEKTTKLIRRSDGARLRVTAYRLVPHAEQGRG